MAKVNELVKINVKYFYDTLGVEDTKELIKVLRSGKRSPHVVKNMICDERFNNGWELVRLIHILTSPNRHWRNAIANKFRNIIEQNTYPF